MSEPDVLAGQLCTHEGILPNHNGLGGNDRIIWTEAITRKVINPQRCWWCVRCGAAPDWISQIPDPRRRKWITETYCKCVDVITEEDGVYFVTEIKPYASYQAYGQAVMYARLLRGHHKGSKMFLPRILTDLADPDLRAILEHRDPQVVEIGEAIIERKSWPT